MLRTKIPWANSSIHVRYSVVVYSLFIVAPIVCGFFGVLSSLAIILLKKKEVVALLFFNSVAAVCSSRCRGLVCSL